MFNLNVRKGLVTGLVASGCLLTFSSAAFAQTTKPVDVVVTVASEQAQVVSEPGVLIVAVESESPAAKAGLKRGDAVLKLGDQTVNNLPELRAALATLAAGDEISLTVQHGDASNTIKLTLGERNGQAFLGIRPYADVASMGGPGMTPGVGVQIQRGTAQGFTQAMPAQPGVSVITVVENGPAATAGLQAGDLIVALNGEKLEADGTLRDLLRSLKPGDKVTLTIERKGAKASEVTVTLDENPEQQGVGYFGMQVAPMVQIIHGQAQGFMPGHPGNLPHNLPRRFQEHCAQMEGQHDQRGHRPGRFFRWLCKHAGMGDHMGGGMHPGFFVAPAQEQFFFHAPVSPLDGAQPGEDIFYFFNDQQFVPGEQMFGYLATHPQ